MGCPNLARNALTGLLLVLIAHAQATAAGPAFDMAEAGAADRTVTFTIDQPNLDAAVRIVNGGDAGQVRIGSTSLQAPDGQIVEAQWSLVPGGKLGDLVSVPARGGVDVRVKALLTRPGRHTARLSLYATPVGGTEALQRTIAVVVERQTKALNEDLITSSAPLLVDKGFPLVPTDVTVRIGLRNSAGGPLELRAPVLLDVTRIVSSAQVASLELSEIQPTHGCSGPAGVINLSPDGVCMASFKIPNVPSAGAYTAKISVSGLHGGRRQADVTFNVRLHWVWAVLLVVLGTIVGGFITSWRTRGRQLFQDLADVAVLQRRLDEIREPAKARSLPWVVDALQAALVELRSKIYTGVASQVAESIQQLQVRVAHLSNWLALESAIMELDPHEQLAVNDDLNALRKLLGSSVPAPSADVDQKLNALRERIARARKWTGIRRDRTVLAERALPPVLELSRLAPDLGELGKNAETKLATLNDIIRARETGTAVDSDEEVKKAGDVLLAATATFLSLAEATLKHDRMKPDWISAEAKASLTAGLEALQSRTVDAVTATKLESALNRYSLAAIAGLRDLAKARAQQETDDKPKPFHAVAEALAAPSAGAGLTQAITLYVQQSKAFQEASAPKVGRMVETTPSSPTPPVATPAEPLPNVLAVEWNLAWLLPETAPPERIARLSRVIEIVVDLAVVFVLAIVAVQTLWVPNPSWGTLGDIFTAFLAGAAAYAGIGTAIQQWTTQLQRRP